MGLWLKTAFVLVLLGIPAGVAAGQAKLQDGSEILRACARHWGGIGDYVVDLEVTMNMERVRIPKMNAVLYYKAPGMIHFEAPNFALLPREGFALSAKELVDRYDAAVWGEEMIGEMRTVRLLLVAKDPGTRLQQLSAWVDQATMTIVQTEMVPYRGRSVTMRFGYALQENRYLLPVALDATFDVVGIDTSQGGGFHVPTAPQLEEFRRPPRSGSIAVRYSHYRINTGLSDDIFRRDLKREAQ